MPQIVRIETVYHLSLTPAQFRLVCAALRNELVVKGWTAEARQLQDDLYRQRGAQAKQLAENVNKGEE